jgi:LuxR family transcriptional regulator, maltose regulon positive regulatory protein
MSHKTPLVRNGLMYEPGVPTQISIDTPAWYEWLASESHCSFHFCDSAGEFTARKERKQRGTAYWVAYRQVRCTLYKRYLGKGETLSAARLIAVAEDLTKACGLPLNGVDT